MKYKTIPDQAPSEWMTNLLENAMKKLRKSWSTGSAAVSSADGVVCQSEEQASERARVTDLVIVYA